MTYKESFEQFQKRIDAKSVELVSLDLEIYAAANYLNTNLWIQYKQMKWDLDWLNAEQEKLMEDMRINERVLSDTMF